jgi:hypothetical protein
MGVFVSLASNALLRLYVCTTPLPAPLYSIAFRKHVTLNVTRTFRHSQSVIASFPDKRTRDFSARKRVKTFAGFERSARLKLECLEAATSIRDLAALPATASKRC